MGGIEPPVDRSQYPLHNDKGQGRSRLGASSSTGPTVDPRSPVPSSVAAGQSLSSPRFPSSPTALSIHDDVFFKIIFPPGAWDLSEAGRVEMGQTIAHLQSGVKNELAATLNHYLKEIEYITANIQASEAAMKSLKDNIEASEATTKALKDSIKESETATESMKQHKARLQDQAKKLQRKLDTCEECLRNIDKGYSAIVAARQDIGRDVEEVDEK